jgi:hypothetical protein
MERIGNKKEVFEGKALRTPGGLTKDDLMKNKRGTIVSKKQHANGLKQAKNITAYMYKKGGNIATLARERGIVPPHLRR